MHGGFLDFVVNGPGRGWALHARHHLVAGLPPGREDPVLFEAGFAWRRAALRADVRSVIEAKEPEHLFLTHVHWDHSGAAGYLKEVFPGLSLAASQRSAEIVRRPHARELMAALSKNVVPLVARLPGIERADIEELPFCPFEIDRVVQDGQSIPLDGGLTVEVIATPGHTRDHLSYFIPERGVLVATEASGMLDRAGNLITEFLVDYDAYVSSLKRLAALPVDILCQGHHFVFVGRDEVRRFFTRSLAEADRFRDRVYRLLDAAHGSVEDVVRSIKAEQWDTNKGVKQAEAAYLLNLRARVAHLASRLARDRRS
jgi:glyoxylase-like metal-dependent hydrolase (beta-lactamase superfamily II)